MASESCSSRHFSWLVKSCLPNPNDVDPPNACLFNNHTYSTRRCPPVIAASSTLSSLPDDLLLDCLSRVPPASLPSLALVCRKWSCVVSSDAFFHLRRLRGLLCFTVFAVSATDSGLFAASLRFSQNACWKIALFLPQDDVSLGNLHGLLSHARLSAIGPRIYIIGRNAMVCFDTWSRNGVVQIWDVVCQKEIRQCRYCGKIYVAGGGPTTREVEEYDPASDSWRVITRSPRRRYGCIGTSVDGVFYIIGGLKIGDSGKEVARGGAGAEAHVYASSMDLYDVEAGAWLRSRSVPGGGCVVGACAAMGHIYVLASHAVELSFWKFDARRKSNNSGNGFGEWRKIESPPLPAQVRLDSAVRFSCVGVGAMVVLVQVAGNIDDLLRRSGRSERGNRERLVLLYDSVAEEWNRGTDMPECIRRAACVCAGVLNYALHDGAHVR